MPRLSPPSATCDPTTSTTKIHTHAYLYSPTSNNPLFKLPIARPADAHERHSITAQRPPSTVHTRGKSPSDIITTCTATISKTSSQVSINGIISANPESISVTTAHPQTLPVQSATQTL